MIEIRNVWKEYGDQVVLERVNLRIEDGEFCSMVGASGCGKSTFLRLLLGQERPTRGTILLDGAPLPAEPDAHRGVVFQRYSVFDHLSVVRNVMLGLELPHAKFTGRLFGARRRAARDEAVAMLERVGLGAALDKYPQQLSGGMQQRLAIAQALMMKPRVLLLDEPLAGLSDTERSTVKSLIGSIPRETAVIMIEHDMDTALDLAETVTLLNYGRVIVDGERDTVIADERTREVYLGV